MRYTAFEIWQEQIWEELSECEFKRKCRIKGWEEKMPAEPAKPTGYRQGEGQVWPAVTCDTWSEFLSTWGTAGQAGVKAHFIAEEEEQAW